MDIMMPAPTGSAIRHHYQAGSASHQQKILSDGDAGARGRLVIF
jgi:hypothetical protein